jgi:hypothetical protein
MSNQKMSMKSEQAKLNAWRPEEEKCVFNTKVSFLRFAIRMVFVILLSYKQVSGFLH